MARLIGAAVALLLAWLGVFALSPSAGGALDAPTAVQSCAYDDHQRAAPVAYNTTERGRPAVDYDYTAPPSSGEHGSRGASVRPQPSSVWTYTTYDHSVRFVHADSAGVTTLSASDGPAADAHVFPGTRCAANAAARTPQVIRAGELSGGLSPCTRMHSRHVTWPGARSG